MEKIKKISLSYFVFVSIILLFVVGINAATKSKDISISCAYGTARETVTADITLATVNNPKFSYSNMQGSGKLINTMYYSWCGFSNSYTKRGTGDTMYYTVTGTSKWRDANYREYGVAGQVNYTYKGSLS